MNKFLPVSMIALALSSQVSFAASKGVCVDTAKNVAQNIGNTTLDADGTFRYSVLSADLLSKKVIHSRTGEGSVIETYRVKLIGNGFGSVLTSGSMTVVMQDAGASCEFMSAVVKSK